MNNEIRITVPLFRAVHEALAERAKLNGRAVSREAEMILREKFGQKGVSIHTIQHGKPQIVTDKVKKVSASRGSRKSSRREVA